MKQKKKKIIYKEDDGRTLYPMNGVYAQQEHKKEESLDVNKKEKKAMRRALFQIMLLLFNPIFLVEMTEG